MAIALREQIGASLCVSYRHSGMLQGPKNGNSQNLVLHNFGFILSGEF
jgi:hypothetical protein